MVKTGVKISFDKAKSGTIKVTHCEWFSITEDLLPTNGTGEPMDQPTNTEIMDTLKTIIVSINEIKTDVAELKTDVAELKTDVAELKTDVAVLKTDVAVLKTDVAELKTDVAELKIDVAKLKTDVADIKKDVAYLKTFHPPMPEDFVPDYSESNKFESEQ